MSTNRNIEWEMVNIGLTDNGDDRIRHTLGGYYEIVTCPTDGTSYNFIGSDSSVSYAKNTGVDTYNNHEYIKESLVPFMQITTGSAYSFIPNYKIPIVLVGKDAAFENDVDWRSYIIGEDYSDKNYAGILTHGTFDDYKTTIEKPYELYLLKSLTSSSYGDYNSVNIEYKYNYYNQQYEERSNIISENLLPNLYLLHAAQENLTDGMSSDVKEFINLNDVVVKEQYDIQNIFTYESVPAPAEVPPERVYSSTNTRYIDEQYQYRAYLNLFNNTIVSGSATNVNETFRNVIYDESILEGIGEKELCTLPFYTHLSWPADESSDNPIKQLLINNDLKGYFLRLIKEEFYDNVLAGKTDKALLPTAVMKLTDVSGSVQEFGTVGEKSIFSIDLIPKIVQKIQSPIAPPANSKLEYIAASALERHILMDPGGHYHQINTSRLMHFLKDIYDYLETNYNPKDILEENNVTFSSIQGKAKSDKHIEILGYRISKLTDGTDMISNTYIFNSDDLEAVDNLNHFYDTQVRYNGRYVYQVFKYVAVVGWRYAYNKYQITRRIGTTLKEDENQNFVTDKYCLEFFNANTGQTAKDDKLSVHKAYTMLSGAAGSENSNPYASKAQVLSDHQYLCQFDYTLEPCIKILEVPMTTKFPNVTDPPPVKPEITPYQRKNASQIIGFYYKHESFAEAPYPETISTEEILTKDQYVNANNLYKGENITQHSTKPTYIEVYKMRTKPKSFEDLEGNRVAIVPLLDGGFEYPQTNGFFEEKIITNNKYYYTFRFINAHGMPGRFSPIYECELVDDGGYKYSTFELVNQSSITNKVSINQPSKSFKKLLELVPSPSQLQLEEGELDYSDSAINQVGNISVGSNELSEKLWDKTFKVRLTSKKTGKKLDINVKYEITREQ